MESARSEQHLKRERSVKSLTSLYTVVIGVALSRAVLEVVDAERGLNSVTLSTSLLFLAFAATLFPFFHGALRHLDDVYVENDNSYVRDGALIVDFALLFVHALAFVVLSLLLKKPSHFAWVLIALLSIDVVWGVFAFFGSSSKKGLNAEAKWTLINFVFIGVGSIFLYLNNINLVDVQDPMKLALPIAFACCLRSIIDYAWCKDFYFPR